ncbi:helix-turn-helix transcriptional regulator [Acinetobacter sp. 187]|uniref:helix-turn-helix domain-containing protein n=1 Tax=Acinetobacter lanii TaxID=2715163 RepID=UPI00140C3A38|nr:helix-turn-helix transcriptional regulator [Acinetobacter lanii]NHC03464.1 helix-turn-helix transcriptional regulator [Acinetobacter lanii]
MSLLFDKRNVAEILNDAINFNSDLTQKELAEYVGFPKPNMIYMLKMGLSKVPLDKAGLLAEKLGLDAQEFWFKCLKEYQPLVYAEFERVNKQPCLSQEEIKFIHHSRNLSLDLKPLLP